MSQCLHDFTVIHAGSKEQVEVCKLCGHKEVYKIIDNRIDNRKYLKDHLRDFCQPFGSTAKTFNKLYGHK